MKHFKVGIIGATGMVGQRFATLLEDHPWFEVCALAASSRSAGKTYEEALGTKWCMKKPIPEKFRNMIIMDAEKDVEKIASMVDFVFCAVNMNKDEIKALELKYAKAECPVVSNNSANRFTPDVPMIIPELNPDHADHNQGAEGEARHKTRIHLRQIELLASELRSGAVPAFRVRSQGCSRLHISGDLRRGQDI